MPEVGSVVALRITGSSPQVRATTKDGIILPVVVVTLTYKEIKLSTFSW